MARVEIPESEISWSFGPSGGPGGQHANRSSTRAELRWDLAQSTAIDDNTRATLIDRMPGASSGVVAIVADGSRSQWRNRQQAMRRLNERIDTALRPTKKRRPTRTPARAKAKRHQAKKRRAELKKLRRRPEID
ncbi:MAG: alternative ribosome rescue aminoacyl-tRNA hydrolase ArfB [Acidimicrobiia bacterium]